MLKKRFLSVLLCLCMVIGMLPAIEPTALAYTTGDDYHGETYWGTGPYQCTAFVAWCLVTRNGYTGPVPVSGDAGNWGYSAQRNGYTVNNTPAVGAIAWWTGGTYGHVAWVREVKGDNVVIEEYNYLRPEYHWDTLPRRTNVTYPYDDPPTGYIHIKDIGGSGTPSQPSVSFSPWNDGRYTYVHETDASIGQIINVSNGYCTETGMYLYDATGRQLASAKNSSYTDRQVYFKINEECRYTLTAGTTYKYKFYAVVNGKTYWSNEGSFKTSGTSNQTTVYNLGDNFYATIYYPNGGKLVRAEGGNGSTYTNVEIYGGDYASTNSTDPKDIWHFLRNDNGSYKVVNEWCGWCLDLSGGVAGPEKNIGTWHEDHGGGAERWYITNAIGSDGRWYNLVSAVEYPQYTMDVHNGSISNGANVQVYYRQERNTAQQFNIVKQSGYWRPARPSAPTGISASATSGWVTVNWTGVPEQSSYDERAYDIQIKDPATGKIVASDRVTGTSYTYNGSLDPGSWTAEVRSVNTKYTSNCSNYASSYASKNFEVHPVYTLTLVPSPAEGGIVNGGGQYEYGDYTTIQATPNKGYHFVRWEWPNGDWAEGLDVGVNVIEDVTITAVFKKDTPDEPDNPDTPDASGTCGEGVFWKYDKKNCVLTISGSGRMNDYSYRYDEEHAPWYDFLLTGSNVQIIIEDGVQNIGDDAFFGFDYDNPFAESNVTSVSIGKNVTEIGDGAFRDLALTDVVIPDGVTSLGVSAFYGCDKLVSVKLPESLTHIGGGAFNGCSNLPGVTIPSGITVIEPATFIYCLKINTINIPSTVTRIEDNAFSGSGLTKIFIPASVTDIGKGAFGFYIDYIDGDSYIASYTCSQLQEISVDPNNKSYSSRDGVLFSKDGSVLIQYPAGRSGDTYSIPDGTVQIGVSAFAECGNLTCVNIPKSVKEIEYDAFLNFGNIKDIYYAGSESDWNAVKKAKCSVDELDALKQAVIHYNSDIPDDPAVRITKSDIKADRVFNNEGYGCLVIVCKEKVKRKFAGN